MKGTHLLIPCPGLTFRGSFVKIPIIRKVDSGEAEMSDNHEHGHTHAHEHFHEHTHIDEHGHEFTHTHVHGDGSHSHEHGHVHSPEHTKSEIGRASCRERV